MINNYLDFVKGRRKLALHDVYRYRELSTLCVTDYLKGFYMGMKMQAEFESRHWRTLQKDIEARLSEGDLMGMYDPSTHVLREQLS